MNSPELASFLRTRREALQPEDVGLSRGPRRRANGLRREEVAELAGMSTDYYARLERSNAPAPSEQMVGAIARALRLSLTERDHLFHLTGHTTPTRAQRGDHINPGLMRVLDRLHDTPAQVMNSMGETLAQTPLAVALLGEQTQFHGDRRSNLYRWFTEPESRQIYPERDHERLGRVFVAQHRGVVTQQGSTSRAAALARRLTEQSPEFAAIWADHEVGLLHSDDKWFVHPEVGELSLNCQVLLDPDQEQCLLIFTAKPGTDSYERLHLLSVIGALQLHQSAALE
ncbi:MULTISPECIES: helix-turn-helix transcriptional regulator [Subtercola]|uniref:XRE family transcriptional regulator n=1 Tax=Subtercola vilae TaxID=2056433 RepID=A0A4T2BVD0_9MICO|nr:MULTISPECIES: helix-turn-helix transcriptional regulator [Subtercola]MEA9984673.1 helix-turn-helix transcriptional regulator [Subtercola sp. RTI3]TIH35320.1 XRE family transcriptional regulator [Subtercola vilae]